MSNYQDSKALVLNFYEELEATSADHAGKVLSRYTSSDYRFRGVHPFNELDGADAVAEAVWKPLLTAFTPMQRRQDIFMAGTNNIDGTEWVTSMGKFMGLFDDDWLGIPATGKITFLPYVEFSRIDDGRICESAFFCDIISVMKQAGLTPLPIQTGAEIINPGPRTHDGLMFAVQDEAESRKTLDLVNRMCDDLGADGLESAQPEGRRRVLEALYTRITVTETGGLDISIGVPVGVDCVHHTQGQCTQSALLSALPGRSADAVFRFNLAI